MVFEFTAVANLECSRRERAERLQRAALHATLAELRATDGDRRASVPARWLGLMLIALGRTLQRWDADRVRARAEWQ